MSVNTEIITCLFCFLFAVFLAVLGFLANDFTFYMRRMHQNDRKQKIEAKESIDQLSHKHSAHWDYIKDKIPWRIRLQLSRFRGKERALTWRIKLLAFFAGFGPQVAEWILEEYMITAKVEEKPAPGEWTCPKCGTHNQETALFCKNCGEYK